MFSSRFDRYSLKLFLIIFSFLFSYNSSCTKFNKSENVGYSSAENSVILIVSSSLHKPILIYNFLNNTLNSLSSESSGFPDKNEYRILIFDICCVKELLIFVLQSSFVTVLNNLSALILLSELSNATSFPPNWLINPLNSPVTSNTRTLSPFIALSNTTFLSIVDLPEPIFPIINAL